MATLIKFPESTERQRLKAAQLCVDLVQHIFPHSSGEQIEEMAYHLMWESDEHREMLRELLLLDEEEAAVTLDDDARLAIRWVTQCTAARSFEALDLMLNAIDPEQFSQSAIAGILTYTWAWSQRLPSRLLLIARCENLSDDPEWAAFMAQMRRDPPRALMP